MNKLGKHVGLWWLYECWLAQSQAGHWSKAHSSSWWLQIWTSNLSHCFIPFTLFFFFLMNMLTCSVESIFNVKEILTSTVLCNCLTNSNYTFKNRVTARSCTYVSHTSSYEVMFPWHRPLQSVGVFHHTMMTDEREHWVGRGGIKQKSKPK